jgi:hypothetical protein
MERYQSYVRHLQALMTLKSSETEPLRQKISDLVPSMSLGDRNRLYDLQHYVTGPGPQALVLDESGNIDEQRSFRYVDYFPLLASQVVRNSPQTEVSAHPLDFTALSLPVAALNRKIPSEGLPVSEAIWLYGNDDHQLLELVSRDGDSMQIRLIPTAHLSATANGDLSWQAASWQGNLPFRLYEDANLSVSDSREQWLSAWHSEREWLSAIHRCQYSNGVIGITEELRPPESALGVQLASTALGRLELRRRGLVQPDFHVFAADHWNFNVRNFNPGGNHGSFLRISTHSVWMMAGGPLPPARHIEEPWDSLNFGSTLMQLLGKDQPLPSRVVHIAEQ